MHKKKKIQGNSNHQTVFYILIQFYTKIIILTSPLFTKCIIVLLLYTVLLLLMTKKKYLITEFTHKISATFFFRYNLFYGNRYLIYFIVLATRKITTINVTRNSFLKKIRNNLYIYFIRG